VTKHNTLTCPDCGHALIDDPASCALTCSNCGAVVWRISGQLLRRAKPQAARRACLGLCAGIAKEQRAERRAA